MKIQQIPEYYFGSGIESDGALARMYSLMLMVLKSLFSFQLQHILTLLTMAIGSFALASTLFVGDGALKGLWDDLDNLMGNRVIVYPDAGPNRLLLKRRPTAGITEDDLNFIKKNVTSARYVEPRYFGKAQVSFRNKDRFLSIDGVSFHLNAEKAFQAILGRNFSEAAKRGFVYECLLTKAASEYFKIDLESKPLIGIDDHQYLVVGIIPDPPEADPRFQERVVVPYFTAQRQWGEPGFISNIVVAWALPQAMEITINDLRRHLDLCRAPNAYYLSSSQFKIKKRKKIVSNFMAFGSAQSLFCILVATIGVVNVMLANVVRRMREFAIRVAMGAKQRDIVILVLSESFMLGFLGSALGIATAIVASPPLCKLISSRIPEASQLTPTIGLKGILIPLCVCSLSSFLAGIIPALQAGKLNILSILRAE